MNMIHRFMGCIREYKKPTILTLLCMVGEVAIEVLIPFFTANLVNEIKGGAELSGVVRVGLGLILMSLVSLGCGALGGLYGSRASAGFAKNVRHDVFTRVQSFAFENIDKFSSASLVTRMTTDINNVQMSFMMCIRIAVRAPLMFLFAVIMAYIMGGALATFKDVHPCIGCDKCVRTGECTFEADDMKELNRTFSRPTRSSSSRRSIILTSTPSSRRSSTAFMPTMKR